jgi:hypothetical protein
VPGEVVQLHAFELPEQLGIVGVEGNQQRPGPTCSAEASSAGESPEIVR